MSMQALLNNGDEVLIPAPDYPLWTAAVSLAGGKPVHYLCDEQADWFPDLEDIKAKITPNTKALVIINPNNPTGAVYSRSCCWACWSWPASTTWWCSPTRSTTRSSTTKPCTSAPLRWPQTCCA